MVLENYIDSEHQKKSVILQGGVIGGGEGWEGPKINKSTTCHTLCFNARAMEAVSQEECSRRFIAQMSVKF